MRVIAPVALLCSALAVSAYGGYYSDSELVARDPFYSYDDASVYTRDAEPEFDEAVLYAREAAVDAYMSALYERGAEWDDELFARGNVFSKGKDKDDKPDWQKEMDKWEGDKDRKKKQKDLDKYIRDQQKKNDKKDKKGRRDLEEYLDLYY